jgi:hypothetical protein
LGTTGSDLGDEDLEPSPPQKAESGRGRSLDKLLPLRLPLLLLLPLLALLPNDLSRFISPMMPMSQLTHGRRQSTYDDSSSTPHPSPRYISSLIQKIIEKQLTIGFSLFFGLDHPQME